MPDAGSQENAITAEFISNLRSSYLARVDSVDFARNATAIQTQANEWVKNQTRGLIDLILSSPPAADTKLLLLNVIYFRGKWKHPFDKQLSRMMTFFNDGKNEAGVDFMIDQGNRYQTADAVISGQKVQSLRLDYSDNRTCMIILLPEQRNGLPDMIANSSFESDVSNVLQNSNFTTGKVDIWIPKFKLETDYNLIPVLENMGLSEVFSTSADFSRITGTKDLFVSQVKHKAFVKVDEEGTEAAGVTLIAPGYSFNPAPTPTFKADHPFIFLIKDMNSGLVLFAGKVDQL